MITSLLLMAPFTILYLAWSWYSIKDLNDNPDDNNFISVFWLVITMTTVIFMFVMGLHRITALQEILPEAHAAPLSTLTEIQITSTELAPIYKSWGGTQTDSLRGLYLKFTATAYYTELATRQTPYHERMHHMARDFATEADYALFTTCTGSDYYCAPREVMAREYADYKARQEDGLNTLWFIDSNMTLAQKVVELKKVLFFMRAEMQ